MNKKPFHLPFPQHLLSTSTRLQIHRKKKCFQEGKVDKRNVLVITCTQHQRCYPPPRSNLSFLQFSPWSLPNKPIHNTFLQNNFIFIIPSSVVHKLGYVSWQCPFCPKPLPDSIVLMLINSCLR